MRRLRRLRHRLELYPSRRRRRNWAETRHRPIRLQQDFTCIEGFCPSQDSTRRGASKPNRGRWRERNTVPSSTGRPCGGVSGSIFDRDRRRRRPGVVTISALLAMAAHMMEKGVTVLDMAGLAQKWAVYSHVRICDDPNNSTPYVLPPVVRTLCWAVIWSPAAAMRHFEIAGWPYTRSRQRSEIDDSRFHP